MAIKTNHVACGDCLKHLAKMPRGDEAAVDLVFADPPFNIGYAYDEYYPGYKCTQEAKHFDAWLEAILFSIRHNVPIHCGEFGISMIQPDDDGLEWLDDYLAFFERFGIGWNWWNYSGRNVYRTGLAADDRVSPNVAVLRKWFRRSGAGVTRRGKQRSGDE